MLLKNVIKKSVGVNLRWYYIVLRFYKHSHIGLTGTDIITVWINMSRHCMGLLYL